MKLITITSLLFLSITGYSQTTFLAEEHQNYSDGVKWNSYKYKYDSLNRIISKEGIAVDGSSQGVVIYEYEEDSIILRSKESGTLITVYKDIIDDGSLSIRLLDRIEALESRLSQLEDDNITSNASNARNIAIFPNPTSSYFTIPNGFRFISVNNQEGQKVAVNSLSSYKKDISGLSSGIYIVLVEDAKGRVYSKKIVKK